MKKLFKEPLLHFLVIGALIFVVFSVVNKEEIAVDGKKIVVTAAEIERLSDNWSKKWNRPPTETELQGLVESYIKEEVLSNHTLKRRSITARRSHWGSIRMTRSCGVG